MERYGAWGPKKLYGRESVGVIRSTFLVGGDGRIERAWYNVRADGHASKVLEALAELKSKGRADNDGATRGGRYRRQRDRCSRAACSSDSVRPASSVI